MKKYLLLLFFSFGFIGFSQEEIKPHDLLKYIKITDMGQTDGMYAKNIVWDYSKIKSKKPIVLEILPIKDCFNAENASRFKEIIKITIDGKQYNYKDNYVANANTIYAKCFKWRIVLFKNGKESYSFWQYSSIL